MTISNNLNPVTPVKGGLNCYAKLKSLGFNLSRISQGSLKSLSILAIMSDSETVPGMGILFQARKSTCTFAGQW
jgi:hypothetical protein